MERQKLAYLALVLTIAYGCLFGVIGDDIRHAYAAVGALVVTVGWISVGMLGRDDERVDRG